MPILVEMNMSFLNYCALFMLPGIALAAFATLGLGLVRGEDSRTMFLTAVSLVHAQGQHIHALDVTTVRFRTLDEDAVRQTEEAFGLKVPEASRPRVWASPSSSRSPHATRPRSSGCP